MLIWRISWIFYVVLMDEVAQEGHVGQVNEVDLADRWIRRSGGLNDQEA